MNKITKYSSSIFLFLFSCHLIAADFRSVEWGMSPEEVDSYEDGELLGVAKNDNGEIAEMHYKIKLGDLDFMLAYQFKAKKLAWAGYIKKYAMNNNTCYRDFKRFFTTLIEKYGFPYNEPILYERKLNAKEDAILKEMPNTDNDRMDILCDAVREKDFSQMYNWRTSTNEITLLLYKNNNDGSELLIQYLPKENLNLKNNL